MPNDDRDTGQGVAQNWGGSSALYTMCKRNLNLWRRGVIGPIARWLARPTAEEELAELRSEVPRRWLRELRAVIEVESNA